jgi:hypothetical protein
LSARVKEVRQSPGALAHCIRALLDDDDSDGVDGDAALVVIADTLVKIRSALTKS